jgi:ribose 5-phosphate isomerase B
VAGPDFAIDGVDGADAVGATGGGGGTTGSAAPAEVTGATGGVDRPGRVGTESALSVTTGRYRLVATTPRHLVARRRRAGADAVTSRPERGGSTVRIALGSDHAGFDLKQALIAHLSAGSGHELADLGTHSRDPVDYPPICAATARRVVNGAAEMGIVIGGSGQGEAIAANKVHGARAALCHDEYTARFARMHNDANVLSLGARIVAVELAIDIVELFLSTAFEHGRHEARLAEIAAIEAEECGA